MFKQIDNKLDCKWQENKDANINKQGRTKNEQTDKVSYRADIQFSIQNKNKQKPSKIRFMSFKNYRHRQTDKTIYRLNTHYLYYIIYPR